jgi:hypothetical protein
LRSICRDSAPEIGVQPRHHLFQLADLALLFQHAGQRDSREPPVTTPSDRSPRLERDDRLGRSRLAPQRQRALQILDDQDVASRYAATSSYWRS